MQLADQGQAADDELDGSDLRIGIVQARFNADITQRMAVCASPSCAASASTPN